MVASVQSRLAWLGAFNTAMLALGQELSQLPPPELATPPAPVIVTMPAPARYDCTAEYEIWEQAWTPDWKDWCCKHESRGCPVTPNTAASSGPTKSPTAVLQASKNACDHVCEIRGISSNCRDSMRRVSEQVTQAEPDPLKAAYDIVAGQCEACGGCPLQNVFVFQKFEEMHSMQGRAHSLIAWPLLLAGMVIVSSFAAGAIVHRNKWRSVVHHADLETDRLVDGAAPA